LAKDRPKKIALIGATGCEYGSSEARGKSFAWDRLKKFRNLADYNLVNLNLPGVGTDITRPAYQHHGRDAIGA